MRWGATRGSAAAAASLAALLLAAAPAAAQRPAELVNPFMGTEAGAEDFGTGGGAGNTYPGASAPFGMLNCCLLYTSDAADE